MVSSSNPSSQIAGKAPTDGLNLPLPPVTLDFAIRGDAHRESSYQRYVRKGDCNDASTAVIGKGGFGTAYRFLRDDSFTPPSSMMDVTFSSADNDMTSASDLAQKLNSHQAGVSDNATSSASVDACVTSSSPAVARSRAMQLQQQHASSVPSSPQTNVTALQRAATLKRSNKAPAVVVVKVCRTPTSGSYDELPKTGAGRTEAKRAAQEVADGIPMGEHTRIVRGEARLLRFLQMCQTIRSVKSRGTHVVRLLADIPMPKSCMDAGMGSHDEDDNYSGPPVPRLLIFERLVDLDAELTPRGWSKSKLLWTVEKVEQVSKDAMAGLRFIHAHCVVHGDLKPSNFMRDARTGTVKLIDLGASRRWVRLHNMAKERTTAVEELDQAVCNGHLDLQNPDGILCEGLGSLTGSPHFMAPEVLLQAGRYLAADGIARNVLDDYVVNRNHLPRHPSVALISVAHRDFKRGWGIKADVWSWGCSVLSLLHRTLPSEEKPPSNSVCAFDFSFESDVDALPPLWPLHSSNDTLPRFHQWARLYALRIMSVVDAGVVQPAYANALSPPFMQMLRASMLHQDSRPSSAQVVDYLNAHTSSHVEYMSEMGDGGLLSRAPSRARSVASHSERGLSLPDEPHNVDLSCSSPSAMTRTGTMQLNTSEVNLNSSAGNAGPQLRVLPANQLHRQPSESGTGYFVNNMQSSHITSSKLSPSPQIKSAVLAPSPLQFQSSPDQMAMMTRPNSAASSHQSTSASGSEHVAHAEMQGANGSPMNSVNTAMSTPIMLDSAKMVPLSYKTTTVGGKGVGQDGASMRMEVESRGASTASLETGPSPTMQRQRSLMQQYKPRRGSIFNRMASSLVPRMHHNDEVEKVGGDQVTQHDVQDWQMSNCDDAPQVEYLDDQSAPQHQMDHQRESDAAQQQYDQRPPALPAKNPERKQHSRKSSAYNVLGLDLSQALQAPLRTVRSLTSMRSASSPPVSMPNEAKRFEPAQLSGNSARQSALPAVTAYDCGRVGSENSSRKANVSRSGSLAKSSNGHAGAAAPSRNDNVQHFRSTGFSRGATQSNAHLRSPPASSRHQCDAGADNHSDGVLLRQQHSVPAIALAHSPNSPAFLGVDPYPSSGHTLNARMNGDATSGFVSPDGSGTWRAPSPAMTTSTSTSQHGRLRSWSNIFKRNKQRFS